MMASKRTGLTTVEMLVVVVLLAAAVGIGYFVFGQPKAARPMPHGQAAAPSLSAVQPSSRPPTPLVTSVTYHGDVWLKMGSGQTLSVADEPVFVLPSHVKLTDGAKVEEFEYGRTELRDLIKQGGKAADRVAGDSEVVALLDRTYAARGDAARDLLKPLDEGMRVGSVSSAYVTNASIFDVEVTAANLKLCVSTGNDRSANLPGTVQLIDHESFWKFAVQSAAATTRTDRDGRFVIEHVPHGVYVLCCRVHNEATGQVIYWTVPVADKINGDRPIELSPSNAHVIDY
jgi:hypothetical protein